MLPFLLACAHTPRDSTPERPELPPTVLLVSMDGFRASYLDAHDTPNLDRLAALGLRADGLIPPFPSKTFPSHYTAVTGLYPEHHGLVGNTIYDAERDAWYSMGDRSAVEDGSWYEGEPIWATANKAGLETATLFWVGSEAEIGGQRPDTWLPYDGSMTFEARVDRVLSWLDRTEDRPRFLTLYLDEPDHVGHAGGPEGLGIPTGVTMVDNALGNLLDGLEQRELLDEIDILVTSDHGMAELSRDRMVFLDDAIDTSAVEIVNWSPVTLILPEPEPGTEDELLVELAELEHLACAKKEDLDPELHYADHDRIPPIVCLADEGWSVSTRWWYGVDPTGWTGGTHGYDPRLESMHGIFVAAGPSLRTGRVEAFENVHLYELMCAILELEPAENDGELMTSLLHR
ncbi:MAG: alkaline phosphatase family protein [Proteobacteria bacterium]|nr:alkaline phosphatase family protein [Pseudomonadota bacterium]MCP4917678.1 alkaline phosphatase family protein [Pseudomonadota bacterium]